MAQQIRRTAFNLKMNKSLKVLQTVVNRTFVNSTTTPRTSAGPLDVTSANETVHYSTEEPLIQFPNFESRSLMAPREAIVQSLAHDDPVGLISLNPEVFSQIPLLHVIRDNLKWQLDYQKINYEQPPTRAECIGGGRKPWPQKGLGKARHGSIRSPIFHRGGVAHGPRRYTSKFYMLKYSARILGLTSMFSVKHAQDDLKIVENLSLPTGDSKYLEQLVDDRVWGPSVVFVDVDDVMPENITLATDGIGHMNLMPVYGLNVYSMLKHVTLVLTVAAVRRIEERLMHCIYGTHKMFVDDEFRGKTFGL